MVYKIVGRNILTKRIEPGKKRVYPNTKSYKAHSLERIECYKAFGDVEIYRMEDEEWVLIETIRHTKEYISWGNYR